MKIIAAKSMASTTSSKIGQVTGEIALARERLDLPRHDRQQTCLCTIGSRHVFLGIQIGFVVIRKSSDTTTTQLAEEDSCRCCICIDSTSSAVRVLQHTNNLRMRRSGGPAAREFYQDHGSCGLSIMSGSWLADSTRTPRRRNSNPSSMFQFTLFYIFPS